jgi:hypothetical protein
MNLIPTRSLPLEKGEKAAFSELTTELKTTVRYFSI